MLMLQLLKKSHLMIMNIGFEIENIHMKPSARLLSLEQGYK